MPPARAGETPTTQNKANVNLGKLPAAKAFGGTYKRPTSKTANMLKADLAAADIPYVVDGLYFDFHALRHQQSPLGNGWNGGKRNGQEWI